MRSSRGLVIVLAAVLVVQGLVGVLPHTHGLAASERPALRAVASADHHHDCLACSVHAPAVDESHSTGFETEVLVSQAGGGSGTQPGFAADCGVFLPRGPPRVVVIAG